MNIKKKKVGERRRGEYVLLFLLCLPLFCKPGPVFFTRDYHLIVTKGDTLIPYLPDTLGWIDKVISVQDDGEYFILKDQRDHLLVLKTQLGIAKEGIVLDGGEPLFSLQHPSEVNQEEKRIFVFITNAPEQIDFGKYPVRVNEDKILIANIKTFFSLKLNDIEADTLYEHGIPTHIHKTEGGFGIICESTRKNKIKVY
jgi:hypothetical protein